jgi:glycosyltransferase involved in cell wall biosynthesis
MDKSNPSNDLKLVWCSPHPNHYNGYLFDHLATLPGVDFEAVYFAERLTRYPWISSVEARYPVSYLKKKSVIDFNFLKKKWKAKNELLVIAGWNEPTMILLLMMLIVSHRKFMLVTDTPRLRKITGIREYLRKLFLDKAFKSAFRFLVTGKPGIERAKLLGVKESKLVNFPFATNVDFFTPLANKKYDKKTLLFISSGRLDNAHKGYDIAIQAFHQLKQLHPDLTFRYYIAGDGPDKKALQGLINRFGLSAEVELKGWLELQDLLPFYHSGDVFLHPSHEDPFPNAVLEAMACGLPVIGSDAAGSVKDRVVEGENGYAHQEGNVEELYEKIVTVMNLTPSALEAMSKQARATALQWKVSYHQEVIQRIIEQYHQEL